MSPPYRKKLIEVALPLEAINKAAAREKSIRHGHPSTLHLWWARRPLAACRAVLFASLVDDPDSDPAYRKADGTVDEERAAEKRAELFDLIEALVQWENSVAGWAKPARTGRVKTGHLEERVIRSKGYPSPWWAGGRDGESSQDGRRTDHTSTSGAGLVVPADWPGVGHPSGDGGPPCSAGGGGRGKGARKRGQKPFSIKPA